MLTYTLLPRIAEDLGLMYVASLRSGEFGAAIVRDGEGREFVLKAAARAASRQIARAGRLTERLRARGYPAPRQVGSGVVSGTCWSLQERLPGDVPAEMTPAHARTLINLARSHADAAPRSRVWRVHAPSQARAWADALASNIDAAAVAEKLARVVERGSGADVRERDIVHGDFSHRNYLALGDDVTGIIDWDLAGVGDWRQDLVTLAYWAEIEPARISSDAAAILKRAVRDHCPMDLLASLTAYIALRHLDFKSRAHPDDVPPLVATIVRIIAPAPRGEHATNIGRRAVA